MMNNRFRSITVLFHPDDEAIDVICSLAGSGWAPIAVVNAIEETRLTALNDAGIDVVLNATNVGLARAFNQGIARAVESGADYVVLLDQDSRPPSGMPGALIDRAERFVAAGGQLACVGPRPVDRKRPDARTISTQPVKTNAGAIVTNTVISSGMVIPVTAFEHVGGMWNELFIDQIDHEWCFRAAANGLAVLVALDVTMPHDMGDAGVAIGGRFKPIHRSPTRHYHIVRNTLWLTRCSFIPRRWRIIEAAKLAYRVPAYLIFSSALRQSLKAIALGLRDGLSGFPAKTLSA